jgi:Tol biopolymer transport system component
LRRIAAGPKLSAVPEQAGRLMNTALRTISTVIALVATRAAEAQICDLTRVSLDPAGFEADNHSGSMVLSFDGRFVAFSSSATNLVPLDANGREDVFVHDRFLNTIERVSVDSAGTESDQQSNQPAISADGRFVVFSSWATSLVPGDTNNTNDVFLRDRELNTTTRISVDQSGVQGDSGSYQAAITRNGRWITFLSSASNLVAGDVNDMRDVFLFDRVTGAMELVSVSTSGGQGDAWAGGSSGGPFASEDGRFVVFQSPATNMVPGDTNGFTDVFVRDRASGTTTRVVFGVGGVETNGPTDVTSITPDARFIGLVSSASNLVANDTNGQFDSFVLDRASGTIERVSESSSGQEALGSSWACVLSDDGRFAVYTDTAPNLVANDTNDRRDVFRRDRVAQTTTRVSISVTGIQADAHCVLPTISGDGSVTGFATAASTLVFGDLNTFTDVFVESCHPADTYCFGTSATCPCGNAGLVNAGCASATQPGARLYAIGGPFVSNDTLTLVASGVPAGSFTAFFEGAGPASSTAGSPFGDGLLCLAPPFQTRGIRPADGFTARIGYLPGEPLLSVVSAVPSGGGSSHYQAWYRSAENFCSSATFNMSNAATVQWYP